jgi:hypothetical protein
MLILSDLKLTTRIQYTNFLDFMSNLDTHINSNYLVTLLVNLLTKLGLNLSRIKPINQKNHTQRKKDIFQRQGQQQRRTSSVSHKTLMLKTGLPIQQQL